MECYSEQTCAIFVDGELTVDEARHLRDHLVTCQRCRDLRVAGIGPVLLSIDQVLMDGGVKRLFHLAGRAGELEDRAAFG